MGFKRRAFDAVFDGLSRLTGLSHAGRFSCALAERAAPIYKVPVLGRTLNLICPNELTLSRAQTFFDKEPETLEWMDGFKPGDIMFDVGANVGLYSLYAALRDSTVVAFEPESQNYALLCRNIYLSDLGEKVSALNLALTDTNEIGHLSLPRFLAGAALNNFGSSRDWRGNAYVPEFRQAVLGLTLDRFIESYPIGFPNHLKIDVDGGEYRVIAGAQKTLRDSRLRSVLIEINEELPEDMSLVDSLQAAGFRLRHKKHSAMTEASEFRRLFNYVFERPSR